MPMITFKIHAGRLAIGGALLAVGAGLVSFAPDVDGASAAILTIVDAVLFVLGVLTTVSGLMTVSRHGVIVHNHWSQERIFRALKAAPDDAVLKILQTWIPEEDFVDRLGRLYRDARKRFALHVLLMDPSPQGENDVLAARVKLRWIDRAKAADNITGTAERLFRLKRQLESDTRGGTANDRRADTIDVEIRLYDFLPFGPIYKIGEDVMFVGFYLNHASSVSGPMLEVYRTRTPKIWDDFDQNLTEGWLRSTPYPPLSTGQPHA